MSCCQTYQFPFSNVAFSDIGYSADMKAKLGPYPKTQILYYDPVTNDFYVVNGISGTQVKFDGSTIMVDHGGLATGVVKVS